jgi:hypothetical protein
MQPLTPELREKLLLFHEAYEAAHEWLVGAGGEVVDIEAWEVDVAEQAWEQALRASPLTPEELRIYKMHLAICIANGGELLPSGDEKVSE